MTRNKTCAGPPGSALGLEEFAPGLASSSVLGIEPGEQLAGALGQRGRQRICGVMRW